MSRAEKRKATFQQKSIILKMGQPRPLFHLFSSFQTHITNFTTNRYGKKVHPVYLRCWDSNSRPWEHESPPITTRPGLPPNRRAFFVSKVKLLNFFVSLCRKSFFIDDDFVQSFVKPDLINNGSSPHFRY